jgi:hypothetical protein
VLVLVSCAHGERFYRVLAFFLLEFARAPSIQAAEGSGLPAAPWQTLAEAARKEGKIVLRLPPSAELRKQWEAVLKSKLAEDILK